MRTPLAIVQFKGHLQTGRRVSGTENLHHDVVRHFAGPDVIVESPWRWNSDVSILAGMLARQGVRRVIVVAYSWGAGYAAMKFAKYLEAHRITIPLALFCDPIHRWLLLPRWLPANPLNIYSLDINSEIKLPPAYHLVTGVRQMKSIPRGHRMVPTRIYQKVEEFKVLPYTHLEIDDCPEWAALVKTRISKFLTQTD